MSAPTLSLSTIYVQISWTVPSTTNSFSVTAYKILVKDSTGSYLENTQYCDGSGAAIISAMTCFIPMATMTGSSYNLDQGDEIVA